MSAEKQNLGVNEKDQVLQQSDIESSKGIESPAEYDDLPDPDVGKSDEERAQLVRLSHSCSPTAN